MNYDSQSCPEFWSLFGREYGGGQVGQNFLMTLKNNSALVSWAQGMSQVFPSSVSLIIIILKSPNSRFTGPLMHGSFFLHALEILIPISNKNLIWVLQDHVWALQAGLDCVFHLLRGTVQKQSKSHPEGPILPACGLMQGSLRGYFDLQELPNG